jgi:beta-galactosidase
VQQIGVDFEKAGPALAGTTVESDVAILQDYESRWAIDWQKHNREFDPIKSLLSFYRPLHALAGSVDVISDTAPLTRYKLVVAPALNLLTPAAVANLEAYVRGGGHLVLGQRSAMKDEDNSLFTERQPGPLVDLLGANVAQWYALDKNAPVSGAWGTGESKLWAEQIAVQSPETKTLMTYGKFNGWLDGQPAAVTRKVGQGSITYLGMSIDGATAEAAAKWMLADAGLKPVMPNLPDGVDLAIRRGDGKKILILTNYNATPQTIHLPAPMQEILTGTTASAITLPQYGVAVLNEK